MSDLAQNTVKKPNERWALIENQPTKYSRHLYRDQLKVNNTVSTNLKPMRKENNNVKVKTTSFLRELVSC